VNWIIAFIVTALLWQRDWALALVAGIVIATLLGIEAAICDVQSELMHIERVLGNQFPDSVETWVPLQAMRNSFLGQEVITPRTISLWKLRKAQRALAESERAKGG